MIRASTHPAAAYRRWAGRVVSSNAKKSAMLLSPQFSARFFRSSPPSYNQKHHEEKLAQELKKLHELRTRFDSAGFFDKWKLRPQVDAQEARVIDLQNYLSESEPAVLKVSSPLDLAAVDRYQKLLPFLLDRFVHECEIARLLRPLSPEAVLQRVVALFSEEHPLLAPLSASEVEQTFDVFYRLLNAIDTALDVRFSDDTVQRLFEIYAAKHMDLDDAALVAEAKDSSVTEDIATAWFSVFKTFWEVPYAKEGEVFSNALCGEDYLQYKVYSEELNKVREMLTAKGFKDPTKPHAKSEKSDPKTEKSDAKPKKLNPQPQFKYLDIDLTGQNARLFLLGLTGGLLLVYIYLSSQGGNHEISFQEFSSDFLRKNLVAKLLVINNRTAILELNDNGRALYPHEGDYYFSIGSIELFERNLRAVQDEYKVADLLRLPVVYLSEGSTSKLLINFLPTLLFLGAIYYMTKKASMGGMGGPLGFGKSTAKKFNQETDIKVKFKDVAGMSEAKQEVMEFVKFLQQPGKYEKLGAKIPRGAILSGPPGTGKTLLAKATAGEAGVPFYSVSGSEFVEMFVGVGASRVRDLFKTARENAPSIVFVDEIDAIGKQRSKGNASGSNDERETTLNQLLVEMDGFETSDHVVVLAGTNRADILDKALMRPGRFDRHIAIDNPELQGRKEIFDVHLKKVKLVENIDKDLSGRLAALTPGFSGADIANVCNEAALIAARYNAKAVTLRHFELAIERVIGGVEKKSKLLDPEEKRVVAYHEAGHAVCGWYLKYAHPLLKVSIIPRGQGALGYAQYLPPDQYLFTALQLYDRMVMTLGGRVSEELNFASVTSGAHDDFKKVTNIAQSMVLRFGMSEKVGMVNYADTQSQDNLTKPFSDQTNQIIDSEIERIVKECYAKCKELLTEKSAEVELVAQELLKKEFITREDMIRLLGKRPFPETNDAFDKYLDGKDAFRNEQPADEQKDV